MKWTAGNRDNVEDVRARSGGGHAHGRPRHRRAAARAGPELGDRHRFPVAPGWRRRRFPPRPSVSTGTGGELRTTPEEEKLVDMVDAVMKDAQATWQQKLGSRYQPTRAVIFRDAIQSACGFAQSATGPVLLPGRSAGLPRSRLLQRAARPVRRARRFRAGVRPRPRARSPRAVAARHRDAGAPAAAGASRSGERAVGEARAAGRLLCRRLGSHAAQPGRAGASASGARTAMSRKGSRPPPRSATTASSACPAPGSRPTASPTGRPQQRVTWFRRGFERGDPKACDTFQ